MIPEPSGPVGWWKDLARCNHVVSVGLKIRVSLALDVLLMIERVRDISGLKLKNEWLKLHT